LAERQPSKLHVASSNLVSRSIHPIQRIARTMQARLIEFGAIEIDGKRYERDVVIEGGRVRKRDKKASRPLRDRYGHTPLSLLESLPWSCRRLIVGTGVDGSLPIDDGVREEAARRGVAFVAVPTDEACRLISDADPADTAAVLHVTC
jgi:hypothetical protein